MPALLHHAANGHLTLEFGSVGSALWSALAHHLEDALGFARTGSEIKGVDEGIHHGFRRDDLVLEAGWDNASGDYLRSSSVDADDLLRSLFAGIGPDDSFQPRSDTPEVPSA